ncbi:bifunctional phosphopantothenoylcysteine decarboxylase/phosphopantothenate--cysteine ligase CoaBC [Desulfopila aestuarii]|uniref:Coenzyme A biosynthesis bifunctional protein CoaBC n=1 Tax=Desulfopila aestuarii DSM 18488 TaxID=1121416 RepID=A0A1M7YC30_9BACT|nr:bifunctional phosphopantothenoylcysteine decarboxylase/phosphopantothenate--cysteine ligase CoaBC [Desulfopila aestuarii]SHO50197.1 Phosphopantothenate-cysteine ligase /Phosphopantothenoylcysteine decarboxylase [Desulfopila aestuarii DSM 18488]
MSVYAGKKVLVGVSGSIAAFKVAGWVSTLAKAEARVSVIMTNSATRFVTPLTFSALSGEKTHVDMFDNESGESMAHINLGRDADLIIIAPASAQTIARLAHGLADDLLSTTILASRTPVYICPAMNSRMYSHPATQENIEKLKKFGYHVIDPQEGMMACKEEGPGRLPEWEQVDDIFQRALSRQDLSGQTVLVTAGPTREPIDPARFLSNRSSGKMGFALARAAWRRGAKVILVAGPGSLPTPGNIERINVQTALEMHEAVMQYAEKSTIIIKAAAVADYRAKEVASQKIKKEAIGTSLELEKNPDILLELGRKKRDGQVLVGFAAESSRLIEEGTRKLQAKNLDLIAVNNISSESTGFEVDTNQVLLISREKSENLPFASKEKTADLILDQVVQLVAKETISAN